MKYPVLIYVTKAGPFLFEDRNPNHETFGRFLLSEHSDPFERGEDDQDLNGLVSFSCECEEVLSLPLMDCQLAIDGRNFPIPYQSFLKRSGLSEAELHLYGEGKNLYAFHFENLKVIEHPYPINGLYSDPDCTKPLKRAPQSWGFAYCFVLIGSFCRVEKVLVFSIRSTWCCKYGNGEKDLEIRTTCPKELLSIQGAGR